MKRLFDITNSAVALTILSPLLIVLPLLIRGKMGAPVIFGQMRPGYKGRPFTLYKYRTMNDKRDAKGNLLPDVQFVLIGGGVDRPRLQKRAEEMGLENVTFLPPRSMETMGEIFEMADALIVHLKDDPLFRITIPSKTQAYLYTGKPIIMAMRGDAANLVREAGGGTVCEPDDPQEMMNAIKTLYEMPAIERQKMGGAGHRYYMDHLSFNQGVNQFERIMTTLAGKAA